MIYSKWLDLLIDYMFAIHSKHCDFPCFTRSDILNLVALKLTGAKFAHTRGNNVSTLFGVFGNISYDHLIDAFNKGIEKLREEADKTPLEEW